jgi:hypothetical protein
MVGVEEGTGFSLDWFVGHIFEKDALNNHGGHRNAEIV